MVKSVSSHREFFAKLYGSIEEENKLKENLQQQHQQHLQNDGQTPKLPLVPTPTLQQHPQFLNYGMPTPPSHWAPPTAHHAHHQGVMAGQPHQQQGPVSSSSSPPASAIAAAFRGFGDFPFPGGLAAFCELILIMNFSIYLLFFALEF